MEYTLRFLKYLVIEAANSQKFTAEVVKIQASFRCFIVTFFMLVLKQKQVSN